jgi:hypothetical protein
VRFSDASCVQLWIMLYTPTVLFDRERDRKLRSCRF